MSVFIGNPKCWLVFSSKDSSTSLIHIFYLSGHLLNDCMGISRLITAVDVEIYSKVHLTLFL